MMSVSIQEILRSIWGQIRPADSLHVGHLAVYMMVRHFLERGHKVFLLVGGARHDWRYARHRGAVCFLTQKLSTINEP